MQAALATYQQTVLESFKQVADVLQALNHDGELFETHGRAMGEAETILDVARKAQLAGGVTRLQEFDAQRQYDEARLHYAQASGQRLLDSIQLLVALGGGWWDIEPTNFPSKTEVTR
jgi:outer membrane protein TolC